jgi:hypothetical protein
MSQPYVKSCTMLIPIPRSSLTAHSRWQDLQKRVHAGEFRSTENHGSIRNTLPSVGGIDADTFERMAPLATKRESTGQPRILAVINTALEARDILGTSDQQVIPGFKEYLFPEKPAPLKSWSNLKRSVLGERGILSGLQEIFIERRIGRGFAKVLASTVFLPFQIVAVIVDAPRLAGDHIVVQSKKIIVRAIASEGIQQSLMTMLGGALQTLGGLVRLTVPVGVLLLGMFAGGWPGVAAAAVFEGVYFGEDLAKMSSGEVEEMLLFQGLRDVVGGLAVILGAEFITSLKTHRARDYIHQLTPAECTKLGFRPAINTATL